MLSKFFSHRCKYRTQVEELQARVSDLEQWIAELKVQLDSQQAEITALKTENAELKERLAKYENPKDSSNSSIPPSQDPHRRKYPKKEKSDRPAGAQKGHPGSHHAWEQSPDEIVPVFPQACPH